MSKGVFISNLDTYIGTALYEELIIEESEFELYGTYFNKETSERPKLVKKMLKTYEKPGLSRKYMLEKIDYLIYDLHSGKISDLDWGIKALTKTKLESEKTVIIISSVLSWGGNPHYMVEDKPEPVEGEEEGKENNENNQVQENLAQENQGEDAATNQNNNQENDNSKLAEDEEWVYDDESPQLENPEQVNEISKSRVENPTDPNTQNPQITQNNQENPNQENPNHSEDPNKPKRRRRKVKKVKEIKYKRIGYSESEFSKRIPAEHYAKIKEFEDHLLNLNFENLNIIIVCAGIPYGNCETVFNYFFKSAWLQSTQSSEHISSLPYISTGENLVPTVHVKDLAKIVKKILRGNKPETNYIFAIDQTADKSFKNLISSISRGVGSGLTLSISDENTHENIESFFTITGQDFYIDQSIYEKNSLNLTLTEGEYTWKNFLNFDIKLNPSKFIEEEFEWHCGSGIPGKIEMLLKEFAKFRKLRPLKIVLNCVDNNLRKFYAYRISQFFNIPVINYEKIMQVLTLNPSELSEEELIMKTKYLNLKEKLEFINNNPEFVNEENLLLCDPNEIMIEALKILLRENESRNRGYVLEGMPVNMEEIMRLYYKKEEVIPEGGEEAVEEEAELEMEKNEENQEEKNDEKNDENQEEKNKENEENMEKEENMENIENEENTGEKVNENEKNEEQKDQLPITLPTKKKKKIKPKVYKTLFDKELLPESVITICINESDKAKSDPHAGYEIDNIFWEIENFYQENNIEILNLLYDEKSEEHKEEKPDEMFEVMRIYIERNGRPFNYFTDSDDDINLKREGFVKEKVKKYQIENESKKRKEEQIEMSKEDEFWRRTEKRLEAIKKDKDEVDYYGADKFPTRKFLLLNIMPILTKGMLEVCKINPIDPIDYLADFLFKNSTD